jgi:predicted RecB family nuclease
MSDSSRLSKSRFIAGLRCPRLLWWRVHDREASELTVGAADQLQLDEGNRVGALARTAYPGGVLVDAPYWHVEERVALTQQFLDAGAPVVFEASFVADGVFAAVDILLREPRGWRIVEVKASNSLKADYIPDAAVQKHVLTRAGLEVREVMIQHLDGSYRLGEGGELFTADDVTTEVAEQLPRMPALIAEQLRVLDGPLPDVRIGPQCKDPDVCPFRDRCWSHLPENHVTSLYFAGKKAWAWEAEGYSTITELPEALCPKPESRRQRRALIEGRRIVEPTLGPALARLEGPLAFFDFETVAPAIPLWQGCKPYEQVPAQFSCHREDGRGGHEHVEWLPERAGDPREAIADALVAACAGAASIVTYNVSFEKGCLKRLAEHLGGDRAKQLRDVEARLVDLLPLVREHVYDPAFGGGFSLKAVLPALVSGAGYDALEVKEGATASAWLDRIVRDDTLEPAERERMAEALREYCKLDTWATVLLLAALRELAR